MTVKNKKKTKQEINHIKLDTFSYHFVPFRIDGKKNLIDYDISDDWNLQTDEMKYFMRYISDKFNRFENEKSCVKKYSISEAGKDRIGFPNKKTKIYLHAQKANLSGEPFEFCFDDVYLFLFDTNIGILVYKLLHPIDESYERLTNKLYHLKKLITAKLSIKKESQNGITLRKIYSPKKNKKELSMPCEVYNMYDISKVILDNCGLYDSEICFNSYEGEARSNFLVHYCKSLQGDLKSQDEEEIRKELFYLKRGYYSNWIYDKYEDDARGVYSPSKYIHWGISSEGTACITITDPHNDFVKNGFWTNLQSYYFTLATLALHQKLALYSFINNISAQRKLSDDYIEKCLNEFALFRAHHMFDLISESSTYQTVYKKMKEAYGIDCLYSDLRDQMSRIYESEHIKISKANKVREKRLSFVIALISFYCVFSAMIDIKSVISDANSLFMFSDSKLYIVQQCASFGLLGITVVLIIVYLINYFFHRK